MQSREEAMVIRIEGGESELAAAPLPARRVLLCPLDLVSRIVLKDAPLDECALVAAPLSAR